MNRVSVILLLLVLSGSAGAVTWTITGASNWSDMSPAPDLTDQVIVKNGATLTVDVTNAQCDELWLGDNTNPSKGNGTLVFGSASAKVTIDNNLYIGDGTKTGSIDMTNGGTLDCHWFVYDNVGTWTKGIGTVEIGGGWLIDLTNAIYDDFYNLTINKTGAGVGTRSNRSINVSNDLNVTTGWFQNSTDGIFWYDYTVSGDITIAANGDFNFGGSNIRVTCGGDLTNNGTLGFAGLADTYFRFNGSVAQSVNGSVECSFEILEIFNTSATGVTLNKSAEVTTDGSLVLNDGLFYTSAANLFTFQDGSTCPSGSKTSHIDGPTKKVGNEAFIFHVGKAGEWARIGITAPATATTEFTAEYFRTNYTNTTSITLPLLGVSFIEYWTLSQAVNTDNANDVKVTLYWENATNSGIDDAGCAGLEVAHFSGGNWVEEPSDAPSGTCTGAGTGSVTTTSKVSSYSPFSFGNTKAGSNALPVELIHFSAIQEKGAVKLDWATATELNNEFFVVEKSQDGNQFEPVETLFGAGTSNDIQEYQLYDNEPYNGVSYYRLTQIDFDGKMISSELVAVECKSSFGDISVYPNPVRMDAGAFYIDLKGMKQVDEVLVVVRDLLGHEVYSKIVVTDQTGNALVVMDVNGKLPPGVYSVVGSSNNELFSKKIVVQ